MRVAKAEHTRVSITPPWLYFFSPSRQSPPPFLSAKKRFRRNRGHSSLVVRVQAKPIKVSIFLFEKTKNEKAKVKLWRNKWRRTEPSHRRSNNKSSFLSFLSCLSVLMGFSFFSWPCPTIINNRGSPLPLLGRLQQRCYTMQQHIRGGGYTWCDKRVRFLHESTRQSAEYKTQRTRSISLGW